MPTFFHDFNFVFPQSSNEIAAFWFLDRDHRDCVRFRLPSDYEIPRFRAADFRMKYIVIR